MLKDEIKKKLMFKKTEVRLVKIFQTRDTGHDNRLHQSKPEKITKPNSQPTKIIGDKKKLIQQKKNKKRIE
jgi:hypothetical protein